MLALFPALAAMIAIFGIFADPEAVRAQLDLIAVILPDQVSSMLGSELDTLLNARPQALGLTSAVSVLVTTVSARAGVNALMMGLNLIGHERDTRTMIWNLLVGYFLTIVLIFVSIIAVIAVVVIPTLVAFFPFGPLTSTVLQTVRWTIAIGAVAMGIGMLYRYGPSPRPRRMPLTTFGNLLASVMWVFASVAFSLYLSNFSNYSQVYGSLGAVIAMLMWLYVSAFVVLLGAELNAEIELRARRLIRHRNPHLLGIRDHRAADPHESGL